MDKPKDYVCLKWTEFQSNLSPILDLLRKSEEYADVTLIVEGKSIKCHKVGIKRGLKSIYKC